MNSTFFYHKIIVLLITASLLISGCGGSESTPEPTATTPKPTATTPAPTATAPKPTTTPADLPPIKIGVLSIVEGPLRVPGLEGIRGAEMAFAEFGDRIAGRAVTYIVKGSDGFPESALATARKLFEEDEVDILIGPFSNTEAIVIRDYIENQPRKTALNGSAASTDLTLRGAAANYFRFSMDGGQWQAGLGTYAYETRGHRRVVIVATTLITDHVGSFVLEFCQAGGEVLDRHWVSYGTNDFGAIIATLPTDIDAVYVALFGPDAINFLQQYGALGGSVPLIANATALDQSALSSQLAQQDYLIGTLTAGPVANVNPDEGWQRWVDAYHQLHPDGLPTPSVAAHDYYISTKAALLALEQVGGDLSDGQAAFQAALRTLEFDTPSGPVRLDHNRNAIATNLISEVVLGEDGKLATKVLKVIPDVSQTLGMTEEEFLALGPFSQDNPSCEAVRP